MTVTSLVNKVREEGDGTETDFDFAFPIFNTSELEVYKIVRSTEIATQLILGVDFTAVINTVTEGGTVTYTVAPTALQDSFIKRVMPLTQATVIPTESNFPETSIENEFDKSRMIDIQLKEQIDRALSLPITSEVENAAASAAAASNSEVAAAASAASIVVDDDTLEITTNIHIKALGVDTAQIAAFAVTAAKIEVATITAIRESHIKSGGSAGGDLTGTYPNPTVNSNKIDNANMLDDAIHTAELYTDVGSASGTASGFTEITMNDYSFFPNIYTADTGDDDGALRAVNDNTASTIGRFGIWNTGSKAYDVQWRYVKASDPERWIYAAFNKLENEIQHIWESGDHPFMTDPNAFPNPFTQFVGNPDYEVYLIDNKIWDTLKDRISRNDRVARIILDEYEVDKVSIPIFKDRTLVEFDEWGDRSGKIIKTFKNLSSYGKIKTLKQRIVNELPLEIKYRSLKAK